MFSFLSSSRPVQEYDFLLRNGSIPESKDDKATPQSLLLYKPPITKWKTMGSPEPDRFSSLPLIDANRFPELLRTLLVLADEVAIANLKKSKMSPRNLYYFKERQQSLQEFARYYSPFVTWLKTPEAKICFNQFCKDITEAKRVSCKKVFKSLKSGEGFFSEHFSKNKSKYARALALNYFAGDRASQFVDRMEKKGFLTVELIAFLSRYIPQEMDYNAYDKYWDVLERLEFLKSSNLLSVKYVEFLTKCPDHVVKNYHVIHKIETGEPYKAHADFILKHPQYAHDIADCFAKLHGAGMLEKYCEFISQHLDVIVKLTDSILKLEPERLFEKYRELLSGNLKTLELLTQFIVKLEPKNLFQKYQHIIMQNIEKHQRERKYSLAVDVECADLIILLTTHSIKDEYIIWLLSQEYSCKSSLGQLANENILQPYQDFIFKCMKENYNFSDIANGLIYLKHHGLLSQDILDEIYQKSHVNQHNSQREIYLIQRLRALELLGLLDKSNILNFMSYSAHIADCIVQLNQYDLISGNQREAIINAFKQNPKSIVVIEEILFKFKQAKVAIPDDFFDQPTNYLQLARAYYAARDIKEDLVKNEIYRIAQEYHTKYPKFIVAIVQALYDLNLCLCMDKRAVNAILQHAEHAHDLTTCIIYTSSLISSSKFSKPEKLERFLLIFNNSASIPLVASVLRALGSTTIKLSCDEFTEVVKNPKQALAYVQSKRGRFTCEREEKYSAIDDFHQIRQTSQCLAQALRTHTLFKKLGPNVLSNIAIMATSNKGGHLHPDIRYSTSLNEMKIKGNKGGK